MSDNNFKKIILSAIAVGIWVLVLQNAGVLSIDRGTQNVNVRNTVDTYSKGGSIDVSGEVNVDIRRINGWNAANYKAYDFEGQEYHSLGTR